VKYILNNRALTNSEISTLYRGSLAIESAVSINELTTYLVHDL